MILGVSLCPMRVITPIWHVAFPVLLLTCAGCEPVQITGPIPSDVNSPVVPVCVYYAPVRIDIIPLTEFSGLDAGAEPQIDAYVSLLDAFGSQVKSPARFRFELYERVERSADPKGERVKKWPESDPADPNTDELYWTDLSDPAANNRHWRDFLRAYQFSLGFRPTPQTAYILEATCLTPDGRRLTTEFHLKPAK